MLQLLFKKKWLFCQRDKFFDGERIALLHDALEECLDGEQRIIIDIKETRLDIVQVILDTYKKYPKLLNRSVVSSFNPIIVYMVCIEHWLIIYMPICKYISNFIFRLGRKSRVLSRVLLGDHIFSRERRTSVWKHSVRYAIIICLSIWQLVSWRLCTNGCYHALSIISLAFPLCCCIRT